jgi:hypothetical protein
VNEDRLKLWLAIGLALLTKWLMTDEDVPPDEAPNKRFRRWRRAAGGIASGALIGLYGHESVIRLVNWWSPGALSDQDTLMVGITLALTGEHVVRWLLALGPAGVQRILGRIFGGRE